MGYISQVVRNLIGLSMNIINPAMSKKDQITPNAPNNIAHIISRALNITIKQLHQRFAITFEDHLLKPAVDG
jgi:hypothetical protein